MRSFILTLLSLLSLTCYSQDVHFSQSSEIPLLINPGATGAFNGWERINLNHRNQWLGAETQFMTSSLAADINILKNVNNPKAHMGIGILFFNDIGGDAKFGTRNISLSLSGIVPLGKQHQLSAGAQVGLGHRSGDIGKLHWGNQFDGEEFNTANPSGEINTLNSFFYPEVSAGIYYKFRNVGSSFSRNSALEINAGFAMYHINKPKLQFSSNSEERQNIKYVIHADAFKDFSSSKWGIEVNFVQFLQGPHYETLIGAMARYRFSNGGKITTFKQDAYFAIGASVRIKDAFIPMVQFSMKGFKVGISYDVTTSKLRKSIKGGSLEFSLSYTNLSHALFKRRRAYK